MCEYTHQSIHVSTCVCIYHTLTHCFSLLFVLVQDGELELCPHFFVLPFGPGDQNKIERDVLPALLVKTTRVHTEAPAGREGGRERGETDGEMEGEGEQNLNMDASQTACQPNCPAKLVVKV